MSKKNKLTLLFIILFIVLFVGLILCLDLIFDSSKDDTKAIDTKKEVNSLVLDGVTYKAKKTVNYLFIGIDTEGKMKSSNSGSNRSLNDVLLLLSFNIEDETYTIIPINRDTMCDINIIGLRGRVTGTSYKQIAYAHTEGNGLKSSFLNTVTSVKNLLYDLDIERYVGLTMSAVPIINDYIDGVDVTLDEDLTEIDNSWINGATIHLNGENALSFIRARQNVSDGSNISRMHRQALYIEAFLEKIKTYDSSKINEALDLAEDYMLSNTVDGDYLDLYNFIKNYTYLGIKEIKGTSIINNNLAEFYVDVDSLKKLLIEVFYYKK